MKKIMFNDRYGLTEAVLQGRKTVTRREISKLPNESTNEKYLKYCLSLKKPPYKVGEIVAVAQSYGSLVTYNSDRCYPELTEKINDAHNLCCEHIGHLEELAGWTNKMFVKADLMPYQIRILDVRAERLQDITEEDCLREGILKYTKDKTVYKYDLDDGFEMFPWRDMKRTPQEAFASLINKISGKGTWESNPFVWRIEFELVK